jgi:ATP-dependent DNA ligase
VISHRNVAGPLSRRLQSYRPRNLCYTSDVECLPRISPTLLERLSTPFDHVDWVFEVKHDGFRAVAYN